MIYHVLVTIVKRTIQKLPPSIEVRSDEPLKKHTTIGVGGPADVFVVPKDADEMGEVLRAFTGMPVFVLGGGANIVVSDQGIRGVVVSTAQLDHLQTDGETAVLGAGLSVSDAAWHLGSTGNAAIHFLYGMPGSVGGAIWMNARCYGSEVSDVLRSVTVMDFTGDLSVYSVRPEDFSYKRSPFQDGKRVIISAQFTSVARDARSTVEDMLSYKSDREAKGHFAAPSAGSMFKNNRAFGAPTGKLIDQMGMRGLSVGGAKISEEHGNIFVNTGTATATDFRALVEHVQKRAHDELGFDLETEVLFAGDWEAKG